MSYFYRKLNRSQIGRYEFARTMFTKMLETCAEHNAKLVIVYLPRADFKDCPLEFLHAIEDLRNRPDFLFVNPYADFLKLAKSAQDFRDQFCLGAFDLHPNAAYNEEVSKVVAERIRQAGFI